MPDAYDDEDGKRDKKFELLTKRYEEEKMEMTE
jgi:hypothetical protein